MKKSLLLLAVIAMAAIVRASDLVVEEYGLPPSYSSIQSAINAASAGDRIFIKNKAGNLPWLENITITQSLDLLAFTDDSFFIMQGTVTISPTSFSTIDIIGMINLTNGISTGTNPTGDPTILRILNGQLASDISVGNNNYNLTVHGTVTNGISYRHGVVVGNTVGADGISVSSEGWNAVDTGYIFGNIINANLGIQWASTSSYFDIRNNFVNMPGGGSYCISVSNTVANSAVLNKVYNNTVAVYGNAQNEYGIYVSGAANSQIDVQNNVVARTYNNSYYGYYAYGIVGYAGSGGNLTVTYNYVGSSYNTTISGTLTTNLNNNTGNAISLNGNGTTQNGVGANGGNPGPMFYNTDLTVNSAGCYGGSYTLNNFFPGSPNYAMTWLTNYTFTVRTGNTINIKASSYDK